MRALTLAALAALCFSLAALPAAAAEATRETYVAAVEPICKANTEASGRILAGVAGKVKAGKLKVAAAQFEKASRALQGTWRQLSAVPRPPADRARLEKWLGYVKTEVDLLKQTAKKLTAGQKLAAEAMAVRLTYTINAANDQVSVFEFHYCHVKASQFT